MTAAEHALRIVREHLKDESLASWEVWRTMNEPSIAKPIAPEVLAVFHEHDAIVPGLDWQTDHERAYDIARGLVGIRPDMRVRWLTAIFADAGVGAFVVRA